jgi:hypothetical protein
LNIDGQTHEPQAPSPEAPRRIAKLQLVDQELIRLQVQIGIAQTARAAYANVLKALPPRAKPAKEPSVLERAMAAGDCLQPA